MKHNPCMRSFDSPVVLRGITLGALIAVVAATYWPVVRHPFVVDDSHTIVSNTAVHSITRAADWWFSTAASSSSQVGKNYRPVLMTSYGLDYVLWNGWPGGFHVTNLLIHLCVVVMTYALALRLWQRDDSAWLAAATMALHPVNVDVVNYVAARSSSLSTLWVLAALWLHDAARGRRSIEIAGYGAGLAALGTKETAFALPMLVTIWDRANGSPWNVVCRRSIPWLGLATGAYVARSWLLHGAVSEPKLWPDMTTVQNLLFGLKIVVVSIQTWIWPVNLAFDYGWASAIRAGEAWTLLAVGAVGVIATWRLLKASPKAGWCLVWYGAAMAPLAALPFVTRIALYQDQRAYLAFIGLSWLVGGVAGNVLRGDAFGGSAGFTARLLRYGAAVLAVTVALGAVGYDRARTRVWASESRLWEDTRAKYPGSALAFHAAAVSALEAGRLEDARTEMERANAIDPHSMMIQLHLARIYGALGGWERAAEALETLSERLAAYPLHRGYARLALGEAYENLGFTDRALVLYDELVAADVASWGAFVGKGRIAERQGRLEDALLFLEQAAARHPDDASVVLSRGSLLVRLKRWSGAITVLDRAVALAPDSSGAHLYLGAALEGAGDISKAVDHYQMAERLSPQDPAPRIRLGAAYAAIGRYSDSRVSFETALAFGATAPGLHFDLAVVSEHLGDREAAVRHYRDFIVIARKADVYESARRIAEASVCRLEGCTPRR